jgi:membrane-bound ClpP family serine protease
MVRQLILPVILQIIGVTAIIAEFILPSAGLLTVAAVAVFVYSLFIVFTQISVTAGVVFVAVDILMIPVLVIAGIKLLAASPVTLRASLDRKDGAMSQPPEWAALVGKEGTALTDLRPAGSAMIGGKKHDVVSRGEYIVKGAILVVTAVDGNRIVVKQTTTA